jgi:hypothetical protein
MTVTTPDWLARRGGTLRPASDSLSWFVDFEGEPQYRLMPFPVGGQHGCKVSQTINGRRLDSGGIHPSVEAALAGGLEDVREALGW